MSIDAGDGPTLPLKPSRDNYARSCDLVESGNDDLPDHITACECETHHGVCDECNYKITVGSDGVEYGHARATNRRPDPDGVRRDCPKRSTECNPGDTHEWDGYDADFSRNESGGGTA